MSDQFDLLRNDLAVARAFDNRVGTFAVAEALRQLSEDKANCKPEILAVSNIMEEVGLLGARQIAYTLKPDVALVVDVTHATDYPTVSQQQHGDVKIGSGPALTHGGCNHPEVVARLEAVAKAHKIKLQHEASSNTTGTDTDVIFWTRGGIPSALISLPNRYMHSPVEVVSLKDLEQIPPLLRGLRPFPQKRRRIQSAHLSFFQFQKAPFHFHPISKPAERSIRRDDAMAWNHQANGIASHGLSNRSRPTRLSCLRRQLSIRARFPEGDPLQSRPHPLLKRRSARRKVEGKLPAFACQILLNLPPSPPRPLADDASTPPAQRGSASFPPKPAPTSAPVSSTAAANLPSGVKNMS